MKNTSPRILVVSGEASGDMYAAELIKEIRKHLPSTHFYGLGGEKSRLAGMEIIAEMTSLSVVGFAEVLQKLHKIKAVFNKILAVSSSLRPDAAILIDYPGFNLRLAAKLKKIGIPVIYYVSPQIWAWGAGRIKTIRRNVDMMIVLFNFEEKIYKKADVPVFFSGHPLAGMVKTDPVRKAAFIQHNRIREDLPIVTIMPGSRRKEITALLTPMLESCAILNEMLAGKIQFLLLQAPGIPFKMFQDRVYSYGLDIKILYGYNYEALETSDFALVASGTAALEAAILEVPMAIMYKLSFLTWMLLRIMLKIKYAGIVNIIADREIVKEFLQYDIKPERIAGYAYNVLSNRTAAAVIKKELRSIKESLGSQEAIPRAAEAIAELIDTKRGKNGLRE
ncbi:MAG: lipid-A-disaccharide synthase [Candidatus Omnitrophota bacterium]